MERAAEARSQEVQSLTAARNEARTKFREAEDALQLAKSAASHSETAKTEALRQVRSKVVLLCILPINSVGRCCPEVRFSSNSGEYCTFL